MLEVYGALLPAPNLGRSANEISHKRQAFIPFVFGSMVLLMMVALLAYTSFRLDLTSHLTSRNLPGPQVVQLTTKEDFVDSNLDDSGFELPTVYGVYALTQGKLIELKPLPITAPDQRVAISAIFSNLSLTKISTGKISFVLFRRNLSLNAPDRVSIRIVARVARQLKFAANKPAVTTAIDGQWAIRSNAYEYRAAPLNDLKEMIVARPEDIEFSLPAGRYALVFERVGYDFTIAGRITDAAQCLERSDTVGGTIYAECRQPLNASTP